MGESGFFDFQGGGVRVVGEGRGQGKVLVQHVALIHEGKQQDALLNQANNFA